MWNSRSVSTALLLALSLSLTGCAAHLPPVVVQPPKIPPPAPELMVAPSSDSYSEKVQQLLSIWQQKLTGSLPN